MPLPRGLSITFCVAMLLIVRRQSAGQGAAWHASIVSPTSEEPEFVSGQNWPGRPDGHRWIKLIVQLTSPGKKAMLPVNTVKLVRRDANYPMLFAVPQGLNDLQLKVGDNAALSVPAVP